MRIGIENISNFLVDVRKKWTIKVSLKLNCLLVMLHTFVMVIFFNSGGTQLIVSLGHLLPVGNAVSILWQTAYFYDDFIELMMKAWSNVGECIHSFVLCLLQ